jgi:hypothetical protein
VRLLKAMTHRRGILPFDSEHLTDPEKALQIEQEHHVCCDCDNLTRQHRGGARGCSLDLDVAAVLRGDFMCDRFLPIRTER